MNDRYDRQLLLSSWDQDKLYNSTITIVGLGALGTVAATSLAMAGMGKLILIDFDTIEISNLNRQLFYRPDDVGRPKVEIALKVLNELNPDIKIEIFNKHIEEVSKKKLKESTVIVEGVDTFRVRRWINSFIVSNDIPLVSGGIYGFMGNVQVVLPKKTPCLECQALIPENELQKACTPFGAVRKELYSVDKGEDEIVPSLSSVSFVIGGLMAQQTLKIVLGLPPLKKYLFWDGKAGIFTSVPLKRRENCFVCSETYHLTSISIHSPKNQTLNDFLLQLQYSFNLGPDATILYQTSQLRPSKEFVGDIFKTGDVFRVVDPILTTPLKFKINVD